MVFKIAVSQMPSRRIPCFYYDGTTCLIVMLVLLVSYLPSFQMHSSIDSGRRVSPFVANAFSPSPHRHHPYQQRRRIIERQKEDQNSNIQIVPASRRIRPLGATIPFFMDVDRSLETADDDVTAPPFLIESISKQKPSGDAIYKTISNLCIDVFFKELLDPSGKGRVNLLKEWQINYLKNLQSADLERRRDRYEATNEMFLAYEVKRTTGTTDVLSQPLLMEEELKGAFNMHRLSSRKSDKNGKNKFIDDGGDSDCYVRGDLLGFVEITQRPYGLGQAVESSSSDMTSVLEGFSFNERPMRPVLTNLAVLKAARKYGIGSKLLEACEEYVRIGWNMNEIVLEVEDYNTKGLEFYRQRGYEVLFSDPASRRYDIEGFWLNKVRCRREIMRKVFGKFEKQPTSLFESADNLIRRIVGNF
mmetsp:Transcript_8145/g.17560  ORF Transcript_8145/g.17560 Transcript_8145/m.17560 type:complete len:417 (+) Transcript_8145:272-1522(+)|eukprot:CAMPEP_0168191782 /NCGR_PEP_ID=MMETSP0139_2-20121125/17700_1 /TAXON_ID=44445 /ORGANISM="Pseudo-nitzschia australis, Strain 10249 10 AB" /LENGTH=416 /DNA_ID=CAMNT_0008114981 /DNA_START=203 /DNA_END=1453 /DNA_ORIENTATION=-